MLMANDKLFDGERVVKRVFKSVSLLYRLDEWSQTLTRCMRSIRVTAAMDTSYRT